MIKVTVWNEYVHEIAEEEVGKVYPEGIHGAIASFLRTNEDMEVRTATLKGGELTEELLNDTDVILWWGHMAHNEVPDELAEKIRARVNEGMGFIALHSAHHSKPFKKLMGTSCNLRWSENNQHERVWNVCPSHPITRGIGEFIDIPQDEMYGEYFDIPAPDELLFITWHKSGEVFRSGCTFKRGNGKIFYFQPGHETYPIFYNEAVQKVLTNAVRWAAPVDVDPEFVTCKHTASLEEL